MKNNNVEYNYFWADTFLGMSRKEFEEFCEMYKDIKLPFWMQTRPETIDDYNIKKLSEVGLHRISFGIEHGNEEGYVAMPNVNMMEEMVSLMEASRSYEANTAAFNATKNMAQSALDLGRNV